MAPRSEAQVTRMYHLVQLVLVSPEGDWDYDGAIPVEQGREFIRLVDQERAERDHREPGPLAQ